MTTTTTTRRLAIAAAFSLTLVAPAFAGEEITEHETYEKRSMKIETVVPAMATTTTVAPSRVYEHHQESESTTTERRSVTPPPAPIVKERTQKTTETEVVN